MNINSSSVHKSFAQFFPLLSVGTQPVGDSIVKMDWNEFVLTPNSLLHNISPELIEKRKLLLLWSQPSPTYRWWWWWCYCCIGNSIETNHQFSRALSQFGSSINCQQHHQHEMALIAVHWELSKTEDGIRYNGNAQISISSQTYATMKHVQDLHRPINDRTCSPVSVVYRVYSH